MKRDPRVYLPAEADVSRSVVAAPVRAGGESAILHAADEAWRWLPRGEQSMPPGPEVATTTNGEAST